MSSQLLPEYADLITKVEPLCHDDYYKFVFQFSSGHYDRRVEMAGFTGKTHVLDAGCGHGQWALALARKNQRVTGIELNPNMVEISRILAERSQTENVTFRQMALPNLEFEDNEFDLIWCWGVVMFLDFDTTLREFYRVLKPGGRLLVGCCNSRGRWLQKLLDAMKPSSFNSCIAKVAIQALLCGHRQHAVPNYTSRRQAKRRVGRHGFKFIAADYDGHIDVTGLNRTAPMFAPRVYGFEQNIEMIAEKPQLAQGSGSSETLLRIAG